MSDSDEDRNNRHTRFHITGSWRLERATAGNEFERVFDYSEGAIIVSGKGRRMLIDRSESLWGFFNEILTRCEQQDNPTEPEWLTTLRKEAWHATMKDRFWLTRDEVSSESFRNTQKIDALIVETSRLTGSVQAILAISQRTQALADTADRNLPEDGSSNMRTLEEWGERKKDIVLANEEREKIEKAIATRQVPPLPLQRTADLSKLNPEEIDKATPLELQEMSAEASKALEESRGNLERIRSF